MDDSSHANPEVPLTKAKSSKEVIVLTFKGIPEAVLVELTIIRYVIAQEHDAYIESVFKPIK